MEYLNYYLYKRILNNLDEYIKNKIEDNDINILNFITFKYIPNYYSKKDKYNLKEGFSSEKFNDFIVECAINLDKENDFYNLLFLYSLIISDTSFKLLNQNNINKDDIDYYISKKYDIKFDIDFYKNNNKKLYKYNEKMHELVSNPLVRIFDLFNSYYYFVNGYKKYKKKFKKEIDNYVEKEISFDQSNFINKKINNIDEFIEYIIIKINDKIISINEYLFEQNDKKFREEFNINKEKKV